MRFIATNFCTKKRNNFLFLVTTVIGSAIALYMAIKNFITVEFKLPCYIRPSSLSTAEDANVVNCCGPSRSVSIYSNSSSCYGTTLVTLWDLSKKKSVFMTLGESKRKIFLIKHQIGSDMIKWIIVKKKSVCVHKFLFPSKFVSLC